MIINAVKLTNIGAYKGVNNFDFKPDGDRNVILIGGENGAGKTTLLNAIKIGLFGAYGFGYKTESADYYRRVESILNHSAKKLGENNFKIKLDFTLVDEFVKTDYTLYRLWKFNKNSLKETLEIIANGAHLSDIETDVFLSKLKEIMPPQLLDLCLFDGEEISRIVNENLLSDYLKNLSRVVFNLDLFETLEEDLENYSNQSVDVKTMANSEIVLFELNKREKEVKAMLSESILHAELLTKKKNSYADEFKQVKEDFEKHGGLIKEQRDEILKQINQIESIRKQNMDVIKDFVASLLPFFINKDLLIKTREQIQNEEKLQLYKQLDSKLSIDKIQNIILSITDEFNNDNSSQIRNEILNLLKPEREINQIHGASFSESSLIENMFLKINEVSSNDYLTLLKENRSKLADLQILKEKLKINDTTNEFNKMLQSMEYLQHTLLVLENEINETEIKISEQQNELDTIRNSIDKLQAVLRDSEKTKSSFLESQKIITLSRRFREIQNMKKLQQVQIEASSMLKRIFRKQNYVSSIIIDPKTYEVTLLDSNKEQLEKTSLSAGEKEILLISIIWAIFKCSGRKVPFIFDTLLGRLDKTHKVAILTEFIPNCGRQAIILSTDSEIDEIQYKVLEQYISKEYTLDFNVENQVTHISNQYFSFSRTELNK